MSIYTNLVRPLLFTLPPERAQKLAEDAFMAKRGYKILELPTGQGLLIKR